MKEFLAMKYKTEHREAFKLYCKGRFELAAVQYRLQNALKKGVKQPLLFQQEVDVLAACDGD
jgi:hypothetical protein